jgi:DNA-binding response OmpR family regulator
MKETNLISPGAASFSCGSVRIDLASHVAWLKDEPVGLRPQEERLMLLLWNNANRVVRTDVIVKTLYGDISPWSARARLRRLVADIRQRLGASFASKLCTVFKHGLILYTEGE